MTRPDQARDAKPHEAVRFIEFEGKYDIVIPAERDTLPDDELVALIMKRSSLDKERAREALAILRGGPGRRKAYDRV